MREDLEAPRNPSCTDVDAANLVEEQPSSLALSSNVDSATPNARYALDVLRRELGALASAAGAALNHLRRTLIEGARLVHALAVRVLPIKGSNARHFTGMLVAWPIVGFLLTTLLTALFGVARDPACQGWRAFIAQLVLRQSVDSNCSSVPFLVDIPTVLLSFTAPFAAVAYLVILRRVECLVPALEDTRLVRRGVASRTTQKAVEAFVEATSVQRWRSWLLFAVSYALTVWLYSRNLQSGGIFETLSNASHNPSYLSSRWWANYNSNGLLAAWCITVGAVGVHFALASSWLYIKVSWIALRANRIQQFELPPQYVPGWSDKSYGWSPITSLAGTVYASAVNFAVSMIAVFDMLRTGNANLAVAVMCGTFGLVSNLSISIVAILFVAKAHRKVRDSTIAALGHPRESRRRTSLVAARMSQALSRLPNVGVAGIDSVTEDLRRWPILPVANPAFGLIKIAPGLYALYQFARSVMGTP